MDYCIALRQRSKFCNMQSTVSGNGASPKGESRLRLRTEILDVLMAAKGAASKAEHARRFGIDRSFYWRLRSGLRSASAETAMNMAHEAGTTVETLFERAA